MIINNLYYCLLGISPTVYVSSDSCLIISIASWNAGATSVYAGIAGTMDGMDQ